jgi:hypothetical protein
MTAAPLDELQPGDRAREFVSEMAWGCGINASIFGQFLEARDDVGAEYALRRLIGYVKAARDGMLMLRAARTADPLPMKKAA